MAKTECEAFHRMAPEYYVKKITFDVLHDAKMTYYNYYKNDYGNLNYDSLNIQYVVMSINDLKDLNVTNIGWYRLTKDISEAYPEHDRPRGDRDLSSVKYHLDIIDGLIDDKFTPPIIFKVRDTYIYMDGMHRLVASYIRNKDLMIAIIIFP